MLTDNEREEIIAFLKNRMSDICVKDFFVWYDEDGIECEDHYEEVAYTNCEADYYRHGCSKLVLFYDDLPHWVVKIPFLGECWGEDDIQYFQYADLDNLYLIDENDYCAAEAYLAEETCKYGLESMFALTYFLTTINGVNIYISENIENNYYSMNKQAYKHDNSVSQAQWLRDSYCKTHTEKYVLTIEDLAFFVDNYGLPQTELLIAFLTDYAIEDLHHGNIGFDEKGNIRIIDYSSFHN